MCRQRVQQSLATAHQVKTAPRRTRRARAGALDISPTPQSRHPPWLMRLLRQYQYRRRHRYRPRQSRRIKLGYRLDTGIGKHIKRGLDQRVCHCRLLANIRRRLAARRNVQHRLPPTAKSSSSALSIRALAGQVLGNISRFRRGEFPPLIYGLRRLKMHQCTPCSSACFRPRSRFSLTSSKSASKLATGFARLAERRPMRGSPLPPVPE